MPRFSSQLPTGVRRLFRLPRTRARMLREIDDEMDVHLAMRVDDLRDAGMTEIEARAEAIRRFGDPDEFRAHTARRVSRKARLDRAIDWLAEWRQDLRFAGRQFRKSPAFVALAVLTLALGIGANTAIFTVVHRLLLAPLPYPNGNRIVMLAMRSDAGATSPPGRDAVLAWRARARSLETIAGVNVRALLVQQLGEQDTIPAYITSNFLDLLGVAPAIGRGFTTADERADAGVAMITFGLWQRKYGGSANVLGSTLAIDGRTYTIVGVTPPNMSIPMTMPARANLHEATPSIWLPASLDSIGGGEVFARLRPGLSAEAASREMQSILASLPAPARRGGGFFQAAGAPPRARALRARDFVDPREVTALDVLFVAVGVLLLIACANVANLLMSRAWTRRREFAVRVALGAGRGRLARLVLTESMSLALAAGALGVVLAWQLLRLIIALRPPALADLAGVQIEPAVLFWTAGISIVKGVLFGSTPALFAGGHAVGDILRNESRAGSADRGVRRMRSAFVVIEIALSLVLLVGAGLLVRSFVALEQTPLGFDPHGLVAADVLLPPPIHRLSFDARIALERQIVARVRAMPGVTDAGIGTLPGEGYHIFGTSLESAVDATGTSRSASDFTITFMTPNYFRLTGMRLLAGRLPDSTRWQSPIGPNPGVAPTLPTEIVVNRTLARQLWGDEPAVGRRAHSAHPGGVDSYVVVGVVEDVRLPGRLTQPAVYETPAPAELPIIARTSTASRNVAAAMRAAITGYGGPPVVAQTVTVGDDYLRDALAPTRFAMALLATFALVALVLSAVGLYGAIAYSVSQRTREIGIRVALGAEARAIVRLVIGDGVRLALAGLAIGGVAAIAATQALAGLLYDVRPNDPLTFAAIAVLVAMIALLASYLPARRAIRIDPTEALRAD
jgi:putative ABC transport system permease protein